MPGPQTEQPTDRDNSQRPPESIDGNIEKTVLLVSTGRTGTTGCAKWFNQAYEQVTAVHEPPPSRNLRRWSNRYLCKKATQDDLVREITSARKEFLGEVKTPVYIESNPFLHGFTDVFDRVFSQPKVVHIVRDPRSYIRSYLNFGAFKGKKALASFLYPYWMLKPEQYNPQGNLKFSKMQPFERVAWRWDTINRSLERGAELFGDRYLRIKYEDLVRPGSPVAGELAQWLDLDPQPLIDQVSSSERVNASSSKQGFAHWSEWSDELMGRIEELCGDTATRYGYELRGE